MNILINAGENLSKRQSLPDTLYSVVAENLYHPDLGQYCTYGIQAKNLGHTIIIHDISNCKQTVIHMTGLFNRFQLSPVHLFDVVEDMLPLTI